MISSIFLTTTKGDILIIRQYKDNVSRQECQTFCNRVIASKEASDQPVCKFGDCSYLHTNCGDVTLVAVTRENANACLIVKFLYRFVDLLKMYFTEIDENSIRKNFRFTSPSGN